jgi:hypothetical protein
MVWTAVYMLWMYRRMMFGPLEKAENRSLGDLGRREVALLVPIALLIVWIGVYPNTFLGRMAPAVDAFVAQVNQGRAAGLSAGVRGPWEHPTARDASAPSERTGPPRMEERQRAAADARPAPDRARASAAEATR